MAGNHLLLDPRVTSLLFDLNKVENTYGIEVIAKGQIHKRTGFETQGAAWRWAGEKVYGVVPTSTVGRLYG